MPILIRRHGLVTFLVVLACLTFSRLAHGQDAPSTPPAQATPWGLGMGVFTAQRAYAGADSKTVPLPLVTYENEVVRIAGVDADLKLGSTGPFRFVLRAKVALTDGYRSGDAPILNGMQRRGGSLWVGPSVQWNAGDATFWFEWLGDALGKSRGSQAKLGVDRDVYIGSFMLTPHLAAEFVDRHVVDYYYGVTVAEATSVRPAYDGRSTVNVEAGLRTSFAVNRSNIVFADIGVKALGNGITDSPLVGRKWATGIAVGYSYRF